MDTIGAKSTYEIDPVINEEKTAMLTRQCQDFTSQVSERPDIEVLFAQLHRFHAGGQRPIKERKKRPPCSLIAIGNQVERKINAGHEGKTCGFSTGAKTGCSKRSSNKAAAEEKPEA
jgi:hypothetical protein